MKIVDPGLHLLAARELLLPLLKLLDRVEDIVEGRVRLAYVSHFSFHGLVNQKYRIERLVDRGRSERNSDYGR